MLVGSVLGATRIGMRNPDRGYAEQIGEEVTVTLQLGVNGQPDQPLILSRLVNPDAFAEMLRQEISELGELSDETPGICVFNEDSAACDEDDELFIWIHDGFLAVAEVERMLGEANDPGAVGADPSEGGN